MKLFLCLTALTLLASCSETRPKEKATELPIIGTWRLLTGTTIKGTDTVVTDFTKGQEMIKIITPTHFSFMRHDLNKGKDSTAVYVAGGGRVSFAEGSYTEYLDYLNIREWEGGVFVLEYEIKGDTLITSSIEKVESLGIEHLNVERLVRINE